MWASFKIVNRYYWKSLFGPGVMLVFSVLFLFVVSSCWDLVGIFNSFMVMPNLICAIIMFIGMLCVPITINSLRTSMIMKRINSSKITMFQFIAALLVYYYIGTLITYLYILGIGFLIYCNKVNDYISALKMINVLELWYATTIMYIFCVAFGLFILCFTKRAYVCVVTTIVFFVLGFFLSPFGAPLAMVHDIRPHLSGDTGLVDYNPCPLFYITYFNPFWYTTSMSYEAFFSKASQTYNVFGSSIFNPSQRLWTYIQVLSGNPHIKLTITDKWLNLFVPVGLTAIMAVFESKAFKWVVR